MSEIAVHQPPASTIRQEAEAQGPVIPSALQGARNLYCRAEIPRPPLAGSE